MRVSLVPPSGTYKRSCRRSAMSEMPGNSRGRRGLILSFVGSFCMTCRRPGGPKRARNPWREPMLPIRCLLLVLFLPCMAVAEDATAGAEGVLESRREGDGRGQRGRDRIRCRFLPWPAKPMATGCGSKRPGSSGKDVLLADERWPITASRFAATRKNARCGDAGHSLAEREITIVKADCTGAIRLIQRRRSDTIVRRRGMTRGAYEHATDGMAKPYGSARNMSTPIAGSGRHGAPSQ